MQATFPSLAGLLERYSQAKIARAIGRPRSFVCRLVHGQPLRDASVIPALAEFLRLDHRVLSDLVVADSKKHARSKSESVAAPV